MLASFPPHLLSTQRIAANRGDYGACVPADDLVRVQLHDDRKPNVAPRLYADNRFADPASKLHFPVHPTAATRVHSRENKHNVSWADLITQVLLEFVVFIQRVVLRHAQVAPREVWGAVQVLTYAVVVVAILPVVADEYGIRTKHWHGYLLSATQRSLACTRTSPLINLGSSVSRIRARVLDSRSLAANLASSGPAMRKKDSMISEGAFAIRVEATTSGRTAG